MSFDLAAQDRFIEKVRGIARECGREGLEHPVSEGDQPFLTAGIPFPCRDVTAHR